jgi:predicted mannosyl-3-phosphoglycerate phosphatase (HAD superfamily)
MKHPLTKNHILEMIAKGSITSAEGFRLFKKLQISPQAAGAGSDTGIYYHTVWEKSGTIGRNREGFGYREIHCGNILIFDDDDVLADAFGKSLGKRKNNK